MTFAKGVFICGAEHPYTGKMEDATWLQDKGTGKYRVQFSDGRIFAEQHVKDAHFRRLEKEPKIDG